jgi:hypothetical protein
MGCPGTFLFLGEFVALGHASFAVAGAGSWFDAAGLAVLGGVDVEFAEDLAGFAVDGDDVQVVDEQADVCSGVLNAELDVVQASAAAQGDRA